MKQIISVYTKQNNDLYVHWKYDDGTEDGAYNLLYETSDGLKTLKEILESKIKENSNSTE